MEITQVKVFPVEEERLKAYVSIVLDDCFLVSDLKVIQGPNGVFVSMPSKRKKNGEFKDIAHPLNNQMRQYLEDKILTVYRQHLASAPGSGAGGGREPQGGGAPGSGDSSGGNGGGSEAPQS